MPPEKDDAAYLWDMLDAAQTLLSITRGIDRDTYLANRTLQLAVERCIEIIGEAARVVSEPFRQANPEVPWKKIVAQRHILASLRSDRARSALAGGGNAQTRPRSFADAAGAQTA